MNSKSHTQWQVGFHVDHCVAMTQGKKTLNFAYLMLYSQQIVSIHGNTIGVINNSHQ